MNVKAGERVKVVTKEGESEGIFVNEQYGNAGIRNDRGRAYK